MIRAGTLPRKSSPINSRHVVVIKTLDDLLDLGVDAVDNGERRAAGADVVGAVIVW